MSMLRGGSSATGTEGSGPSPRDSTESLVPVTSPTGPIGRGSSLKARAAALASATVRSGAYTGTGPPRPRASRRGSRAHQPDGHRGGDAGVIGERARQRCREAVPRLGAEGNQLDRVPLPEHDLDPRPRPSRVALVVRAQRDGPHRPVEPDARQDERSGIASARDVADFDGDLRLARGDIFSPPQVP